MCGEHPLGRTAETELEIQILKYPQIIRMELDEPEQGGFNKQAFFRVKYAKIIEFVVVGAKIKTVLLRVSTPDPLRDNVAVLDVTIKATNETLVTLPHSIYLPCSGSHE